MVNILIFKKNSIREPGDSIRESDSSISKSKISIKYWFSHVYIRS